LFEGIAGACSQREYVVYARAAMLRFLLEAGNITVDLKCVGVQNARVGEKLAKPQIKSRTISSLKGPDEGSQGFAI
jgi:hypothetical protein